MKRTVVILIFSIFLFGQQMRFLPGIEQYSTGYLSEDKDENPKAQIENIPAVETEIYLETTINPDEYIVGPGDQFAFNMVSADGVLTLPLKVTPIGDVLIPAIGTINVDQLILSAAFEKIKAQCKSRYSNASIHITLVNLRKFKVLVIGSVENPGFVLANPMARVSDIIETINGSHPEKEISTRNMKLIRDDNIHHVDLLRYYLFGEKKLNPKVQQGDIIEVRYKNQEVSIYGGVEVTGLYEFVSGEKLSDLIKLAGGFTLNADSNKIEITRFVNDTDKVTISIQDFINEKNLKLFPEDHIVVRMKKDYKRQDVITINGEVKYPGKYSIDVGETTIGDILNKAGGYSLRADPSRITINNQQISSIKDIELKRIALIPYEDRSNSEKAYVKARSGISKGLISSSSIEFTDQIMSFALQRDDVINIPPMNRYVEVLGAIVHPGRYPLMATYSVQDYVLQAGGLSKNATRNKYIIKNSNGQRIPFSEEVPIENGDIIFIAEKLEYNTWERFKEFMMIGGQMAAIIVVIQNALGI